MKLNDLQKEIRATNNAPDIVELLIDGEKVIFTMDNYDLAGKQVTYGNKRTGLAIEVNTDDRYKTGYKDAELELYQADCFRNDITYID